MLRLRNTRTEIQKACLASKPSPSKSKVDPGLPDFSHSSPVRLPISWEQCSPSDYLFTVVNVTMVNVIDYFFTGTRLSLSRQISANCKTGPKSIFFSLRFEIRSWWDKGRQWPLIKSNKKNNDDFWLRRFSFLVLVLFALIFLTHIN